MPLERKRKTQRGKPQNREHSQRVMDIMGVCIIAFAIFVGVSLVLSKDTGFIGDSMSQLLMVLFGTGAMMAPLLILGFGVSLIFGRRSFSFNRLGAGLCLIFLALLGKLSSSEGTLLFDPESAANSGGYVGAIIAWSLELLLGSAKSIGIGTLAALGIILSLNNPIKAIFISCSQNLMKLIQKPKKPKVRHSLERNSYSTEAIKANKKDDDQTEKPKAKKQISIPPSYANPMSSASMHAQLEKPYTPIAKIETPDPKPKIEPIIKEIEVPRLSSSSESMPKEGYKLPPIDVLQEPPPPPKRTPEEMKANIETLERTLEEFKIQANVVEVATGPTITRYEIQLGPGIRVSRITALADNIAMSLAASHVRVEAPIPGKSAIGVEVPNSKPSPVMLRHLCDNKDFIEHPSRLYCALGQDVSGVNQYADLTRMPHLLIGGATNSGKSIGLASIITSLLLRNTPKDLKMVMIDPKRVELSLFNDIPHLMHPVVKDVKEAPGVLRAVWKEMDERYDLFSEAGVRNIDGWNEKASFQDKMSYIVVIIDELADLMIQAAAEVETSICRLAQLARATGIHLVIATQRPSVDVITGTIKANVASRIAFSVSSQIDSRTILDQSGAEKLIGRGDMLFSPINASKPLRIQGAYVSEIEIEQISNHWKEQESPRYILSPIDIAMHERDSKGGSSDQELDALWEEAVRWVVERGQASTSMLQRRFSIGFQRASRLLDSMEERLIVGPRDGSRPRDVLVNPLELEGIF